MVAGGVGAVSLALAWPGIALYDTMRQAEQLSGHALDDWHPPVMARLWGLFPARLGTAPLFALQTAAFYAGLALVFAALPRLRPGVAALAAVALVIPADWQSVVVKDAQMVAALTLATGAVAWFHLRGRPLPRGAVAGVVALLGYALLVRANAAFGVVPLALAWGGWLGATGLIRRAALAVGGVLAVLAVSPVVNHHLLGAGASHVERVLPVFDLAGIAHFGGALPPRINRSAWAEVERRRCYSPYLWDALGDDSRCGFVASALGLQGANGDGLIGEWIRTVVANPVPYGRHRLAHLNATLRWIVPFGQPNAGAPPDSQPNTRGLGGGGTWRTRAPAWVARALAATPFGWPAVWWAASLGFGWAVAGAARSPGRDLALGLLISASAMTLGFAVVSIASDLRYHLWSMVATTLALLVVRATVTIPRMRLVTAAGAVAIVAAAGLIARIVLPAGGWG
ncbi:MAG: hypothetical protein JO290_01060 [Sphingomonadaceae bacterium]|nr:hypothetical protein [Sphingomonadaceae bacterium]